MPRSRPPYPPEFRRQIIELSQAGRNPEELAQEFEPTAKTIRNWISQSQRDQGQRPDGLSSPERAEITRLRRENKQLRLAREMLSKAAAGFARETGSIPESSSTL